MGCRYCDRVPCIGLGWKDLKFCSGQNGYSEPCCRWKVQEERRLAFLEKIKSVHISSAATPTRNKH